MIEHDYIVGDLVSYHNHPAMVTFVDSTRNTADIVYLDDYIVMNVGTQRLHYLGPGKQYLREALAFSKTLMLVEKLSNIKEEQDGRA